MELGVLRTPGEVARLGTVGEAVKSVDKGDSCIEGLEAGEPGGWSEKWEDHMHCGI